MGPGVYRFRDDTGRVIYVGKAKSLRARLNSYFQDLAGLHQRTRQMVTTASSVDWTVVDTEVEALQLEYTWIKEFDPRFNVKYRDDKSYPWLAVTVGEEFPRVMVMRGAQRKGVRYFGPYGHAWAIRDTVDTLLRVFPMRSCSAGVFRRAKAVGRPCLLGDIGKCAAPCVGRVSPEEHREIVNDFLSFMGGQTAGFTRRIQTRMREASQAQEYELAARLRDDLAALNRVLEKQTVVLGDGTDADVLGFEVDPLEVAVQIFSVRGGRIRGQRGWVADRADETDVPELVQRALVTLYGEAAREAVPRQVLVPELPADADVVTELLSELRGGPVTIRVPKRGDKARLMETVEQNAHQSMARHKLKRAGDLTARSRALEEIQESLGLPTAPLRIECYDVSNLQGTEIVASMVVFEDGLPRKSEYRRFTVRHEGQSDVGAMYEVITRRLERLLKARAEEAKQASDDDGPIDPEHRAPPQVRLRAVTHRRRRWPAPGGGSAGGHARPRHHRHRAVRPREATGGGLASRRARPDRAATHQRGPLPAPARARRGAPLRHRPSPAAPRQGDDRQCARRRARARTHPPPGPAQDLRLRQEAARRECGGDRDRARHRPGYGRIHRGGAVRRHPGARHRHGDRRDPGGPMTPPLPTDPG